MESCDLSGKTIVPFCTSGSSGIGSSAKNLQPLVSGSVTWLDGRRFSGSVSREELALWIDGFVKISSGKFTMGSPAKEAEREADEVQHTVKVKSYPKNANGLCEVQLGREK